MSPATVYVDHIIFKTSSNGNLRYSTPLKRKAHHTDDEDASDVARDSSEAPSDDSDARPAKNEYETGRVKCEGCGKEISFRDEATGAFTLQLVEAHRLKW